LANDVRLFPSYIAETSLPHTQAELALPMLVGDELIGVVDVQARQVGRFTDDITRTLTVLSEQFAIAVQNANLYAQQVAVTDELRRLDKIKSHFFASVSHELRTPLNAIINFTEYVQTELLGPLTEGQKEALANVFSSGQHLLSLINDILDMTKIQAGMMQLFVEQEIDLDEELATVLATAEALVREKPDVKFIREIDPHLPKISGDKRRIRQILLNLLSNAIKFTEQGSVKLQITPHGEHVRFVIQDTGVGIPTADQERIFQPFQQTEAGIKQGSGTGLGLPITRNLVLAHGGTLHLMSAAGKGTTFEVLLPIKVQEPAP
jgi:signal transduction histidine kinase